LQNDPRLPRGKQNVSAGIGNQERLIERILQKFADSLLKLMWESGGADWKRNRLHGVRFLCIGTPLAL
jgi:hypothetical protein